MKVGDLVLVEIQESKVPGALTAVKYYARLQNSSKDKPGIVLDINGHMIVVQFPHDRKVIHENFLKVIDM